MENTLVNLNGKILYPDQIEDHAKISVFDRSFLYGDSLYEVVRTYHGHPFALDAHLERLQKSAEHCAMQLGQSIDTYKKEIFKTLKAFKEMLPDTEAYCRLIVSRGTGKIGFDLSCLLTTTQFVIIVFPAKIFSKDEFEKGIKLGIPSRTRNPPQALNPAMKSGNYLNSLLAYLEVRPEYDDAILCNQDGYVTEGTTFNLFYVKNGIVVTAPLAVGILEGITRKLVIQDVQTLKLPFREVYFPKERLYEADEVFATSSLKEVFPVTQVDQIKIAKGKPGPITRRLGLKFKDHIHQETNQNGSI